MASPSFPATDLADAEARSWLVILGDAAQAPPGVELGPSRLTLGAGEDDDVFLSGVGVVPGHVQMVFLDGRATVLRATQDIRIDGQAVSQFPVDLHPLQVLSLSADTHLAYGPKGSQWPSPPPWPRQAEDEGESGSPEGAMLGSGEEQNVSDFAESSSLEEEESTYERGSRTRREHVAHSARVGGWTLAAAAVVVVGLVLFDLIWGSREVVQPQAQAIENSEDVLERLLASDPARYKFVKLKRRNDGAISLTGFIDSDEAYRKLADQVRQQVVNSRGNVRLDAMTPDRLNGLVKDLLSRFPMGSRVERQGDQVEVLVFGVQGDPESMKNLQAELGRLAERIHPMKMELSFSVKPGDQLLNEISMELNRRSATRDMQVSLDETGGRINGVVAAAVEGEARATLQDVKQTFAQQLPLNIELKVDPKLNFTVVSLMLGGNESTATLLQRGKSQTFRVGESVFGTGELKDIRNDGVVLALGRREMFIPLIR
jgi:hypothetical protein